MHSRFAARPRRRGFTLIELLIVIVVIGILVGLLSLAVGQALSKAKVTRIKVELDQLSTAMDRLSADYGGYPPNVMTMTVPSKATLGTSTELQKQFVRFIRKAFPRWIGQYENTADPARGLKDLLLEATDSPDVLTITSPPSTSQANIDDLDQAEILVFFLGGIPIRRLTNPNAVNPTWDDIGFELTGFSADPQNPFRHADSSIKGASAPFPAITQRTAPYFEFDVRRLVDRDRDGWPEYIPQGTAVAGEMPPYVYFGARSYADMPVYPYAFAPLNINFVNQWGLAFPYMSRITVANPPLDSADWADPSQWTNVAFVNPKRFQIVSAGVDGMYGGGLTDSWARLFPSGEGYTDFDNDNLTNFTEGPLEDAKP